MNKKRFIVTIITSAYFIYYALTYKDWHFIDTVNLIIHEAGHIIFLPFGTFMHILGGSLWQVLFPIIFVLYFLKQRDYFSASLVLFWVGQNLLNVSVYASDSIVMQLPLLGGDTAGHDWHNILTMLGMLKYTYVIGSSIYFAGIVAIASAVSLCLVYSFSENDLVS